VQTNYCFECRDEAGYETCICGQETGEQIDGGVFRNLNDEEDQEGN